MDRPRTWNRARSPAASTIPCTKSEDRGQKGDGSWSGRQTDVGVDAANPRPDNRSGHIIEIAEAGDDATATRFEWNVFMLAGDRLRDATSSTRMTSSPVVLASTDTYFGGLSRSHQIEPVPLSRQSRHRSARQVVDRHRHRRPRTAPNNGFVSWCRPADARSRGLSRATRSSGPTGCEVCGCDSRRDGRTLFLSHPAPGRRRTPGKAAQPLAGRNGMPAAVRPAGNRARGWRPRLTLLAEREARSGGIQNAWLRVRAMNTRSLHSDFLRLPRCWCGISGAPAFPKSECMNASWREDIGIP
jgi:hypothetical protein